MRLGEGLNEMVHSAQSIQYPVSVNQSDTERQFLNGSRGQQTSGSGYAREVTHLIGWPDVPLQVCNAIVEANSYISERQLGEVKRGDFQRILSCSSTIASALSVAGIPLVVNKMGLCSLGPPFSGGT